MAMVRLYSLKPLKSLVCTWCCAAIVGTGLTPATTSQALAAAAVAQTDLQALIDQAMYWYERYRVDLSTQKLNRVLLVEPNHAVALKWRGLVEMRQGNVTAAKLWLDKLSKVAGADDVNSIELSQAIALATDLRQEMASIKFLADKTLAEGRGWVSSLERLFNREPLGEAAITYYETLAKDPRSKTKVLRKVSDLMARFPNDSRYRKLYSDLGGGVAAPEPLIAVIEPPKKISRSDLRPKRENAAPRPSQRINKSTASTVASNIEGEGLASEVKRPTSEPELSDFAKGQQLNSEGLKLAEQGQNQQALAKLSKAVELNPDYPWFRYDLALFYESLNSVESSQKATFLMQEGRRLAPESTEMVFASALLASTQNQSNSALDLLRSVPKTQWTAGMSALERRLAYNLYSDELNKAAEAGDYERVASQIESNPRWLAEPEVIELTTELRDRTTSVLSMAFRRGQIDGTEGVSTIEDTVIPIEYTLPVSYSRQLFIRADRYRATAGNYRGLSDPTDASDFGYLGVRSDQQIVAGANNPNAGTLSNEYYANANPVYQGHIVGIGLRDENWSADIGKPVGNFPVAEWLGGVSIDKDIGETGLLRLTLARRMIDGSVLSGVGARDPESGQTWGGVRRNGLTTLYYTPFGEVNDFVGIARYNIITGQNVPTNRELNLQGIVSRRVWSTDTQRLELGASIFLWRFDKNMRFYTYGQGGYYSPQRFASLTIPVTWTGSTAKWSWRAQLSAGQSKSKEDATDLYPFAGRDGRLTGLSQNQRNLIDTGGRGGGRSYGVDLQLEHQLTDWWVVGLNYSIDRSEDFNPDLFSIYFRMSFDGTVKLSVPPEPVTAYSDF